MATIDHPRNRFEAELDRLERAQESGDVLPGDANAIREVAKALDAENPAYVFQPNGKTETKSNGTLDNYTKRLRLAATAIEGSLLDLDTEAVNELMESFLEGTNGVAPEDGNSPNSVGTYQSAMKAFYRYHEGHDVNPDEIPVFVDNSTAPDEREMFTVEEVQAMRDVITEPRERAVFELLANTGQRIRVIQTLRIKDVDVPEGVFWINEEADGTKGASGKRPLLNAREYVHQWLEYHPCADDPEAALITAKPGNGGGGEPGEPVTQSTINYHLKKIAEGAGIEKDVHPHVFRHYFTTVAKRDYGMDNDYIKRIRGDAPGSNVMETTYSHLTDDDAVSHAEEAMGISEPAEEESPLTPNVCPNPVCQHNVEPGSKSCRKCGYVFTPDAEEAKEQIEIDMWDSKGQAEGQLEADVDTMNKLLDENPELEARLVDRLADRLEG